MAPVQLGCASSGAEPAWMNITAYGTSGTIAAWPGRGRLDVQLGWRNQQGRLWVLARDRPCFNVTSILAAPANPGTDLSSRTLSFGISQCMT